MSTNWNASDWSRQKANPDEPNEWYEWRRVDGDGNPITGFALVTGGGYEECRRLPQPDIDRIVAERKVRAEKWALRFSLLPVFAETFTCVKCGHRQAKVTYGICGEFGDEQNVMHIVCSRCEAVSHAKPLDWEDPR